MEESDNKIAETRLRIKKFAKYKKLSQKSLCNLLGVSTAYISSMTNSISVDKADIFRREFPELNIEWLLFGVGDMIKEDNKVAAFEGNAGDSSKVERQRAMIDCLNESVRNLTETVNSQNKIIAELIARK